MQLIDKPLEARVKRASKKLGLPEREIVKRAVVAYLAHDEAASDLSSELRAWDNLSAETMRKHKL